MTGGYIRLHRSLRASEDLRPGPVCEHYAYILSILQAAHTPHGQWFNGTLFQVERGEFVTSLHDLMRTFHWSEKKVRGFMDRMVRAGKWAKRGAHLGAKAPTILTVLNYDLFQAPRRAEGEAGGEGEGERGAKQGRSKGEEQKEGIIKGNEGESKERGASPPSRALVPALPFQDALDAWDQVAALHPRKWKPAKATLSDKRRPRLAKILKEHGIEGWRAALARAHASELLGGPDPPSWWNFDFITKPDKFQNLMDGNYDRQFSDNRSRQQPDPFLAARASLIQ